VHLLVLVHAAFSGEKRHSPVEDSGVRRQTGLGPLLRPVCRACIFIWRT